MSHTKKTFLIISIISFLVLSGVGLWFYQQNQASRDELLIEILGPSEVKAGQDIEYTLRVKNKGATTLEDTELVFKFPDHAQPLGEIEERLHHEDLENLYPGQEKAFHYQARLFGQAGDTVIAEAKMDYKYKGLKAYYSSETELTTSIKTVPLTFELNAPESVPPQEPFQLSINYASYLDQSLSDLEIQLQYPEDFGFNNSDPQGIESNIWQIERLSGHEGGKIRIKGQFDKEAGSSAVIVAKLGFWTDNEFTVLKQVEKTIEVAKAPIYLSQQVNNSLSYAGKKGDTLHYRLFFRNVSGQPLEKQFLVTELQGPVDLESLRSINGTYNPGDNSILWDWKEVNSLDFLGPQEEGMVEFWVDVNEDLSDRPENPEVINSAKINKVEKNFSVKINSDLNFTQKAYEKGDFFSNEGPVPFEIGEETTYTVLWRISNVNNKVEEIFVAADLPEHVRRTHNVFPDEEYENLDYSKENDRLTWEIGTLDPGQEATVAFQLETDPQSEEDLEAPLIKKAEIRGEDQWTDKVITESVSAIEEFSSLENQD